MRLCAPAQLIRVKVAGLFCFLREALPVAHRLPDCPAFTRVAACTLALSTIRDMLIERFGHFVASMTAPIACRENGCRAELAPTGKHRLATARTHSKHPGHDDN